MTISPKKKTENFIKHESAVGQNKAKKKYIQTMGPPELPNFEDPDQDNFNTSPTIQHPLTPSDDSDNETIDAYDGYQPLAMDEQHAEQQQTQPVWHDNNMETTTTAATDADIDLMQAEITHCDPNMPEIVTADAEIERQVWSAPRPIELQIELDNQRTEQILNAMANFTLPNVSVPDWAAGVPEERWKDELLQRIRQCKDVNAQSDSTHDSAGSHPKDDSKN